MDSLIASFDNTALHYDKAALLPRLVATQLLERVKVFHYFQPQSILDLGCGTGYCLKLLQNYYKKSQCFGVDISATLLKAAKKNTQRWWRQSPTFVAANAQQLPFIPEQFDLICANLSLLWVQDLKQCITELQYLLNPQGLLLFTMLGPDTFQESKQSRISTYPWAFCDLHLIGDILTAAQLHDIVVDASYFSLHYSSKKAFQKEIQQLGFHTLLESAPQAEYSNSATQATWEVIYGQAWKLGKKDTRHNLETVSIPISR